MDMIKVRIWDLCEYKYQCYDYQAGEMAQWIKGLPHKYEDRNSDPQSPYKSPTDLELTPNPSAWRLWLGTAHEQAGKITELWLTLRDGASMNKVWYN